MSQLKRKFATVFLLAVAGVGFLVFRRMEAQQGGRGPSRDDVYLSHFTAEPGGTKEEDLWQVLALMGVGDREPADWNGTLSVSSGEIYQMDGYRFEPPDRILPQGGWRSRTRVERVKFGYSPAWRKLPQTVPQLVPKGLLLRGSGNAATQVTLETSFGPCSFSPMNMDFGTAQRCDAGRVEIRRIPPATDLSGTELRQHDFPSIAADGEGRLWTTWMSYHDRQEELNLRCYQQGRWTRLIPVARASADLWRPQVISDEQNKPWLIWSQQVKGNWDLYAMPWEDNQWGKLERLTTQVLPDIEPHAARGADGAIYVVWQALVGRSSRIHLKYFRSGTWSETIPITSSPFNDWEPAVAAGRDGKVWIAWDRYTTSYDVYCRSYSPQGGLSPEMKVAGSARFEAYAGIAVDSQDRPWVAWETGEENWGKDLGAALGARAPGSPLGGRRRIEVACLEGGNWKTPAEFAPQDSLSAGSTSVGKPVLLFDPNGNLWMAFKRRYSSQGFRGNIYFEHYLTRLNGDRWTDPVPLPYSWGRQSARIGLTAAGGRLWVFWPTESRRYAFSPRPFSSRVIAGSLPVPGAGAQPVLRPYQPAPSEAPPGHASENEDVAFVRKYRVKLGSETLRIVRGDLHRHTEFSQDEAGLDDGSLPEFYRYMIDAAGMDFGASTDHQAGGVDYWNFLTQEMADMYLFPERFVPLYGYERNVSFPQGHRNIVHTRRNYGIVPFFQSINPRFLLPDSPDGELLTFNSSGFGGVIRNDTPLLYEELRKSGGIAIPHTSGTPGMGTDWKDQSDPALEPAVEIYQGDRQNYEAKNVPRGIRDGEERKAVGGFQDAGLVWNAWKKGYRLGVIASSDHFSTHISYALVYTPRADRRSIFDAIRKRHTYGATDNIVLEFRLGDHFMGDDFAAETRQSVRVKARGTGVIETIHLIRDAAYIYKVSPGSQEAQFEYRDTDARKGPHWYYVRVEQRNGELAWSSPIWVNYR